MTEFASPGAYGVLSETGTLTIERLLPGPIERIWAYLTESDLRRLWLAAGHMELKIDAPVEFVWRNDELSNQASQRPPGFSDEHRMQSRITELDPPTKLAITWGDTGGVTFELTPKGDQVLLTVIHRRVLDRATLLNVAAGWHMHLDILSARATGAAPVPFWNGWTRLRHDYDRRLPSYDMREA